MHLLSACGTGSKGCMPCLSYRFLGIVCCRLLGAPRIWRGACRSHRGGGRATYAAAEQQEKRQAEDKEHPH